MEGGVQKVADEDSPAEAVIAGASAAVAVVDAEVEQVKVPQKSKEELVELARSNVKLAEKFLQLQQGSEAVDAFSEALSLFKEAFGDEAHNIEAAPVYLKFGVTLMRLAERNMEKALNDVMMDAMRERATATGDGAPKKLSTAEIEEHANEHLEDLDDAWEALEMARLTYETANDPAGISEARTALGDLCIILEDWEGADREFSASAELRQKTVGDSRLTVEAFFLAGLAKESLGAAQKDAALVAFTTARDIMARVVAAREAANPQDPELADLREILESLDDKVVRFPLESAAGANADGAGDDVDDDGDGDDGKGDETGAPFVVDDDAAIDVVAADDVAAKRPALEDAAIDDNQGATKRVKPADEEIANN